MKFNTLLIAGATSALALVGSTALAGVVNGNFEAGNTGFTSGYTYLPGNGVPEGVYDVVQLPTGEIMSADIRKSSGSRAYDDAVLRAILKSSPLPKPDRPEFFDRNLTLKFRPQE